MTVAARVEARLRSLSTRERILVLVCAIALILFAVLRWAVFPAVEDYRKARTLIPERRATLARSQAVRAAQADVVEELAGMVEELAGEEEGLLPGSDPSAAGAALQGILKPMVDRPDTRLTSVRTLPPLQKGEYTEVAVQMDMQTSMEGLASLLAGIPRQQKILRVKKLAVSSGIYSAAPANRPDVMMVSLVVSGLTTAPEEPAVPGGGGE